MQKTKNPAGGRGFCEKSKAHCIESYSNSTARAAQYLSCADCDNLIHRAHDRAVCRWTGERVSPQAHCHGSQPAASAQNTEPTKKLLPAETRLRMLEEIVLGFQRKTEAYFDIILDIINLKDPNASLFDEVSLILDKQEV